MPMKTDQFTGLTGSTYIGVTRAHARVCTADKGTPVRPVNGDAPYAPHLTFSAGIDLWLRQRCVLDHAACTMTAELFEDWQDWADGHGCYPGSVKLFALELAKLGFPKHKTCRTRGFRGLSLKSPETQAQQSEGPTGAATTILALDLGTTTGWALRGHNGLITSGTANFKPGRYDGGGMRYLRFTNWLTELDRLSGPIEAIWFEEVRRHAGTDASHIYGGLMATLTAWAELRGVPYAGVPVGTIKQHATGKGNADKAAMVAAARARGFSPADDNEADAIAILFWAIETQGGLA